MLVTLIDIFLSLQSVQLLLLNNVRYAASGIMQHQQD